VMDRTERRLQLQQRFYQYRDEVRGKSIEPMARPKSSAHCVKTALTIYAGQVRPYTTSLTRLRIRVQETASELRSSTN